MTEQSRPSVTMGELERNRQTAGARLLLRTIMGVPLKVADMQTTQVALAAGLTEAERMELVAALLGSFSPMMAERLVLAVFEDAGWPVTGLASDVQADANYWADTASPQEIRAYGRACIAKMDKTQLAALKKWLEARA